MVFREAVRKADVLDTGYLSESLMNKLAANTGAVPACEQQFFLAMTMCSRNHHGDLNHEEGHTLPEADLALAQENYRWPED